MHKFKAISCALWVLAATAAHAALELPAMIGDHMVLQQKQRNLIWGWDDPGTKVLVEFGAQRHSAIAAADGKWSVQLHPLEASFTPETLVVNGSTERRVTDVLVGEVWICSGQSNMQFDLISTYNGDLEVLAADLPAIRMITIPLAGNIVPQRNVVAVWQGAASGTMRNFSGIGFLYGKMLHEILRVPIGLIDNAWGASSIEAWIRRETLESEPRFAEFMASTRRREADLQSQRTQAAHAAARERWEQEVKQAEAAGRVAPRAPVSPLQWLVGQNRPGNIFGGVLHPTIGYGIRGVIWYQGESNVARATEYKESFPFLIAHWRHEWGQGDFPFYWVQLANCRAALEQPGPSDWAELREAQQLALELPNTGQAIAIDVGEGRDIHPRNKHEVAARLVRIALSQTYGRKLAWQGPAFRSWSASDGVAVVEFDCFGSKLQSFGTEEVQGFAVCGEDRQWKWAKARVISPDRVEVSCPEVPSPIAIRYAWADNPSCNLYSSTGLPAAPFRTDRFIE